MAFIDKICLKFSHLHAFTFKDFTGENVIIFKMEQF